MLVSGCFDLFWVILARFGLFWDYFGLFLVNLSLHLGRFGLFWVVLVHFESF